MVTVNGKVSAEIDDPPSRRRGRLALQVHGGQDCLVYFKDLEIDDSLDQAHKPGLRAQTAAFLQGAGLGLVSIDDQLQTLAWSLNIRGDERAD